MTDAHDEAETAAVTTAVDRLLAAGVSADRAQAYLDAGQFQVDGTLVTDPATPAPRDTSRYMINPH